MKRILPAALAFLASANVFASEQATLQTATPRENTASGRNVNIRIEPHWLAVKELSLDLQVKVARKFTIGPTFAYMNEADGIHAGNTVADRWFFDDKTTRLSLGVRSVFYFNAVDVSSAYLSAFGRYSKVTIKSQDTSSLFGKQSDGSGEFNETSAGLTAGYQWNFGRLTLNVGGGWAAFSTPDKLNLKGIDGSNYDFELKGDKSGFVLDAGLGFQI